MHGDAGGSVAVRMRRMKPPAEERQKALAFVDAQGDAVQRRVAQALAGCGDRDAALVALADRPAIVAVLTPSTLAAPASAAARERTPAADAWVASNADLDALAVFLARAEDLGLRAGPLAERVCARLGAAQAPSGAWGTSADPEAQLRLSGELLGRAAKLGAARGSMLTRAADFVAAQWSRERMEGIERALLLAFAAAFSIWSHDAADEILQWCGRELERGFRLRRFSALEVARILAACDARHLPGARLDPAEIARALRAEQAEDGGWLPGAAPAERVEATLDALAVLDRFPLPG